MGTSNGTEQGDLLCTYDPDGAVVHDFGGNDNIETGNGDDLVYGDPGDDNVYTGVGSDSIYSVATRSTATAATTLYMAAPATTTSMAPRAPTKSGAARGTTFSTAESAPASLSSAKLETDIIWGGGLQIPTVHAPMAATATIT